MLAAVNFCADDQPEVELALGDSPGNGSQIEVLEAGGQWKTFPTRSAPRLRLNLPAFSLVVLRSN